MRAPQVKLRRVIWTQANKFKRTRTCNPSLANDFDRISFQIQWVSELLSKLHMGPGQPSTADHPYISHMYYKKYIVEHKKHGAIIAYLERAYSALASSHRDLKESYKKMVKSEKKKTNSSRSCEEG